MSEIEELSNISGGRGQSGAERVVIVGPHAGAGDAMFALGQTDFAGLVVLDGYVDIKECDFECGCTLADALHAARSVRWQVGGCAFEGKRRAEARGAVVRGETSGRGPP